MEVYICAEETAFSQFSDKGYNKVSLTYFDLNSYLLKTRLTHKERLGVCK